MKKLRLNIMMLAIASIGFVSCGDEKKEVKTSEAEEGQHAPANTELEQTTLAEAEVVFDNAGLETVFDRYSDLKNALVQTNAEEAKEAADQLNNTLTNIDANEALVVATEKISNSDDINVQRDEFQVVSAEIETLIDGNIRSGAVYQQYCPMAFEGKGGYWLSTSKEIRNPYYGEKMLKCGTVEKTFQ